MQIFRSLFGGCENQITKSISVTTVTVRLVAFLADQLTLSQPGGQFIATQYYVPPQIFRPCDGPDRSRGLRTMLKCEQILASNQIKVIFVLNLKWYSVYIYN